MENRFETFTLLISKINRNIKKIKTNKMAKYNLRSLHVSCLYYLYVNKALTASEICEKCEEDKGAVSKALDYLENNEYIVCDSKHIKRYNSPFTLTSKGLVVGKEITDHINLVLENINIYLNETERNAFYQSLNKISLGLNKISNQIN